MSAPIKSNAALLSAAGLALATILTFWLGLRATREWQRSTVEAAATRANEVVTLLDVALEREMKGAQISVLLPFNRSAIASTPYDLADQFARAFVRFPYLESFFVSNGHGATYAFTRADRRPVWDSSEGETEPYPVIVRRDPAALRDVIADLRARADGETRFALLHHKVGRIPYETLAYLVFDSGSPRAGLSGIAGFMVDLDWIRAHYFTDFLGEMQSVIGDTALSVEIVDEQGVRVAGLGSLPVQAPSTARTFPMVFADPALLAQARRDASPPVWIARVGVGRDASVAAAARAASRTLALLGMAGLASLIGVGFALRASRAAATLAAVQSEFVSAVSHEMKTPLSLIKLASNTLQNGRYASPAAIADYGRMMGVEARHLTRLIDNVLCYARVNDTSSTYNLEPLDLVELVHESVDRLRPQLDRVGMQVNIDVPNEPVVVAADHLMMTHVVDNLVDNVTKYAASGAYLGIRVARDGDRVTIAVADCGDGIPAADLKRVFDKFYRRPGSRQRGAGLGLAIVRRIVQDHQGTVAMSSTVGRGTLVTVTLPSAVAT